MRRVPRRGASIIVLAVAVASVPAELRAQTTATAARYCAASVAFNETPPAVESGAIARMHPLNARRRVADAAAREQWTAVLSALRTDALNAFAEAKVAQPDSARFFSQLDSIILALPNLPRGINLQRANYVSDVIIADRFAPIQGISNVSLFASAEANIDVSSGKTDAQQRALCWSAMSMDVVMMRLSTPLDSLGIAHLTLLNTSWKNYRDNGYTRQPLELIVFPGNLRYELPSRVQPLFGHLSAGVELNGRGLNSLAGTQAIVGEIGALWYWNEYSQYSGLSGIVSVASGEQIGIGGMVHFAKGIRAGGVFRRVNGTSRNTLLVSADLYGYLAHWKDIVNGAWTSAAGKFVLPGAGK